MAVVRSVLRMVAGVVLVVVTVVVVIATVATPAAAASPIGPNQHYIGLVNGKHSGAVIYVACPGPVIPGRTSPPAGNQTVAVRRVLSGNRYSS